MTECAENADMQVDISCTSPITNIFCPQLFEQIDHGFSKDPSKKKTGASEIESFRTTLKLKKASDINDKLGISIYYSTEEADKP